jgi:hypothetical protein
MKRQSSIDGTRLCKPRGLTTVFVLALYLLTGALHEFCGFDVTKSASTTLVSMAGSDNGHSEHGAAADHHCHGCFSVSMPAPVVAAASVEPVRRLIVLHDVKLGDRATGIDPPLPKFLT